ncbi:hypothetical protein B0T10DRAFT_552607 [Thelonectria olida]|uniref:Uncharacterized protein n=1 Tax=Thelonectria olida TaxID=1576542 RepID=A0A9P9ALN9_9HYPO|nr:hypothetical protein B0T10DRAFT_552607 [Thelonectria olida]
MGRRRLKGRNAWQIQRKKEDNQILRYGGSADFEALNKRYVGYMFQEIDANRDVKEATKETWVENQLLRALLKKHGISAEEIDVFQRSGGLVSDDPWPMAHWQQIAASTQVKDLYKAMAYRPPIFVEIPNKGGRVTLADRQPIYVSRPYYSKQQRDRMEALGI